MKTAAVDNYCSPAYGHKAGGGLCCIYSQPGQSGIQYASFGGTVGIYFGKGLYVLLQ